MRMKIKNPFLPNGLSILKKGLQFFSFFCHILTNFLFSYSLFFLTPRMMDMYPSSKKEKVSAGDVLSFPSWSTVHRGVPVSNDQQEVFFLIYPFILFSDFYFRENFYSGILGRKDPFLLFQIQTSN